MPEKRVPDDRGSTELPRRGHRGVHGRADGDPSRAGTHPGLQRAGDDLEGGKGVVRGELAGTLYTDPGSPWQNGIVESFNGWLRDELPSSAMFDTLAEALHLIDR